MNARILQAITVVFLALGSARADEAPAIQITDRADHVEILARGAVASARVRPEARGPWLDVPLEKAPRVGTASSPDSDEVTKRGDIVAGDKPRLSVLLHHDAHPEDFARNTQIEQTAAALVVRIPHVASHALPPLATPAVAARADKAAAPTPVAPAAASATTPARVAPAATTVAAATPETSAAAAPPTPAAIEGATLAAIADDKPLIAVTAAEPNHNRLYLAMLLLSAFGIVAILVARRRRQGTPPAQLLRVTSTCQLSPKVKVMLVAVGDREMLLSVGDQGAQVLGRWRADGAGSDQPFELDEPLELEAPPSPVPGSAPPAAASRERAAYQASRARGADFPDIDVELPPASPRGSPSPAVAGLLKLRRDGGRGAGNTVADEQWARDLLAAMRTSTTGRSRGIVR